MNLDIEFVWELYRALSLANRRMKDCLWETVGMETEIEDSIIEYYDVDRKYFEAIKKKYNPEPYFDWHNGVHAVLVDHTYMLAFKLLRRDLEDYKKAS